jgi:selenocysteine lyase/cysteine desulfurase
LPLIPRTDEEIINAYRNAITEKTKVILLTHLSNITGLIIPVRKICALAKQKNIDVIVDSAHALGQIDFSLSELGSDFVGMNLHKWIGNPIGAGVLYVRKSRINNIQQLFGDAKMADDQIMKLAHFGTTQFAVSLTIPQSLSFHEKIGIKKFSDRLHYLKSVWLNEFIDHHR